MEPQPRDRIDIPDALRGLAIYSGITGGAAAGSVEAIYYFKHGEHFPADGLVALGVIGALYGAMAWTELYNLKSIQDSQQNHQ